MSNRPFTPGLPPLGGVKDPDTRRALEAIFNGWRIRNGDTSPDSDERFIRKGELDKLTQQATRKFFATPQGAALVVDTAKPAIIGQIESIIGGLEQDVMNSPLWRALGEQIKMIDTPQIFSRLGAIETVVTEQITQLKTADTAQVNSITALGARVGVNEAGLLAEVQVRTNSDNAIAQALNTIWAVVGNNTGLVQTGSNITANLQGVVATNWNQVQATIKDPLTGAYVGTAAVRDEAKAFASKATNLLTAERTIKVDVNGYVAGFGVMARQDLSTGETSSEMIVRADRFAIGSPSRTDNLPATVEGGTVPFIVTTTNSTINGKTVPPGVYMRSAMIQNGSIGTAQIGVAQVDTLIIAGNAVTVPVVASQVSNVYFYASGFGGAGANEWGTNQASTPLWKTLATVSVDFGTTTASNKAIVGVTYQITTGSGGFWATRYRVVRTEVRTSVQTVLGDGQQGVSNNDVGDSTVTTTFFDSDVGSTLDGRFTYTLQAAIYGDIGYDGGTGIARTAYGGRIYVVGAKR